MNIEEFCKILGCNKNYYYKAFKNYKSGFVDGEKMVVNQIVIIKLIVTNTKTNTNIEFTDKFKTAEYLGMTMPHLYTVERKKTLTKKGFRVKFIYGVAS